MSMDAPSTSISHYPQNPNPNFNYNHNSNHNHLTTTSTNLKTLIQLSQSTLSSLSTAATGAAASTCPYNPHHRIPPELLFSHTLRCPSPISLTPSTFFYQNCPSVVSSSLNQPTTHPFSLPHFLTQLCENHQKGLCDSSRIRFLASEYMFVKKETGGWNDFPFYYSCIIRRVILCLGSCLGFKDVMDSISTWVIVNSPRYGVVIDVSVRDHVLLLFKFCLRAVISEAVGLGNGDFNEFYLKCPVLGQVLVWYATQLSIMYGEMNGKLFAFHMFKQLILTVTIKFLMFSDQPFESGMDDVVSDGEISVSQVEDAVAAFRERSLLEQKIRAVRNSRQLNNMQRAAEHEYMSKRAEEERHNRPDYKPIVEHDLFSWQRGRNQQTNVLKSREELLAEERDYKRRRMSYRGKKMKRTTTQVMRDIIEEYTEEIKAAAGFGHLQHKAAEDGKGVSDSLPVCDTSADIVMEKEITSSDVGSSTKYNRTELHSYTYSSTKNIDQSPKDFEQSKPNQKADRNRDDRKHYSKTPEKLRKNGRSSEHSARGERDVTEFHKEFSRRLDKSTEDKLRNERHINRKHRIDSVSHRKFTDRYNPSESGDMYEDNV